ncbi:acyl-CoA thioesterase [Nigerium massiliense]|uniref:acyl-CoA thioesterase n=1 Tax=Nigerium massiliense TaxID=1522317 RepID=UPI00058E2841|nr:acyl-CoA thioesterase II [Nigerium massiliense]
MPHTLPELVDLLDLEQISADRFRGQHPNTTMQRTFGGQVLAQALSAMYDTVDDGRICHSLSGYFVRPGSTHAPLEYQVQRVRDGGSFSTRRVVCSQNGQDLCMTSASFKAPEDGLEHAVQAFEPPAPPEMCPSLMDVLAVRSSRVVEEWEREWAALDVRYADSSLTNPTEQGASPRLLVWVKTAGRLGDEPRAHQQMLAYASDLTILSVSTLTHPVNFLSPKMQAATINHSMWFHRPIRADEWVLYEQSSPSASNGLGLSQGRLYAGNILGASCAQEGLIRVRPDEPLQD